MKRLTRIISFVLVLTTVLTCVGAGAFAATASTVTQYGDKDPITGKSGYLVFGDSVGRGCGAREDLIYQEYYNYKGCRYITGSFPALVADAVGCEGKKVSPLIGGNTSSYGQSNFWPICFPGMSLRDVMALLDLDSVEGDPYAQYFDYYRDFIYSIYKNPAYEDLYVDNLLKDVRLITIELGMIDIAYRAMIVANFERGNFDDPEAVDPTPEYLTSVLEHCYEGFEYFKDAYPRLLTHIREVNPDATITIVNSFTLTANMPLLDGTVTPLGDALCAIGALMNQYYQKWAKVYGCYYVDISDVETPGNFNNVPIMSEEFKSNSRIMTHPSPAGYEYIARQILSVLPEADDISEPAPEEPVCPLIARKNTDIVFDFGRYTSVDSVLVNGKKVTGWRFGDEEKDENPHEITIPYGNRYAKTLVMCVKENGKLATYVYQLSYKNNRYNVNKLYGTSDTVKTTTTLVTNVVSVGSKLLTAFAGLFKK